MPDTRAIGLRGVSGVLAPCSRSVEQLARDGLLTSAPDVLREFGFDRAFIADGPSAAGVMALEAARRALADAGLEAGDIDLLVWASARPEGHIRPLGTERATGGPDFFDGFRYSSGWLQDALDLDRADVIAVAQQGCATMFAALRTARAILETEEERSHALCVAVDVLPARAPREILYNVISDGACAVVLSKGSTTDRWIGFRQISRGCFWDPVERAPEIMASYFVMGRQAIAEVLECAGVAPGDVDVVLPTGINRRSWDVMLDLTGIPRERLYTAGESFGHTINADSFIQLDRLRKSASVPAGSMVLTFTYGFGSSWCALLLEH
jgi:3-oxoacyl-[acyl-carrier-protein] synthase-3